ncbi:hypothetical protein Lser_V15G05519 [Lactuca serriola]
MVMTRRMSRKQNHDDASSSSSSSSKMIKTDDVDVGPWSYLNHDVLLLVMMQLGVIDFLAFSGVCKTWRLVAISNWKTFMASKSPMLLRISTRGNDKDKECCLEDSQGRKFKTILPRSVGSSFIGLTCGYLIFFREKTYDFWLVNPITRHELHFPPVPFDCVFFGTPKFTAVLVHSPSISSMHVLIMLNIIRNEIWISREGEEGSWNRVALLIDVKYLHAFKGKIYTLCCKAGSLKGRHICELTLNPKPKMKWLKIKNFPKQTFLFPKLISSGEKLYVMENFSVYFHNVHELDFDKMEWVRFQKTTDECGFFLSEFRHGAVVKPELWADLQSQPEGCNFFEEEGHGKFFTTRQWYFPHECSSLSP